MIKGVARNLLDYLAPQLCIYCDQPSHRLERICEVCEDALTVNDAPCPRCALPGMGGRLCPHCLKEDPALTSVTAAFVYDAAIAYLMHRWKYLGEANMSLTAAKIINNTGITLKNCDILFATPLHWRRRLRRGFNQSEDLLEALWALQHSPGRARPSGVALKRQKITKAQAHASRRERLGNLQGAFAVEGNVSGCSVGIVDDVCTTGATGNAMATALLQAGASEVHLFCLARTPSR
ncbi:ComF family protein [Congregibacter sp.]|uniref:ComF family protein n=1 Tax=Congregibacter sp. TaxID=2744308 RepID=UPI003F6AF750